MNEKSFDTFSHEIRNTITLIYSQLQYIEHSNSFLLKNMHWSQLKKDFHYLFSQLNETEPSDLIVASSQEAIDLKDLLDDVATSWQYQWNLRNIHFEVNANDSHYYVYGIKTKYLQIFHNLISNSVKALERKTQKNSPSKITINLSKEGEYCVCNVSDNGIGMNQNQQARAFYRGVSFLPNGNGIGLHVVSEIAKEFHVTIELDSKPNQGTSITLIFPAVQKEVL